MLGFYILFLTSFTRARARSKRCKWIQYILIENYALFRKTSICHNTHAQKIDIRRTDGIMCSCNLHVLITFRLNPKILTALYNMYSHSMFRFAVDTSRLVQTNNMNTIHAGVYMRIIRPTLVTSCALNPSSTIVQHDLPNISKSIISATRSTVTADPVGRRHGDGAAAKKHVEYWIPKTSKRCLFAYTPHTHTQRLCVHIYPRPRMIFKNLYSKQTV